ncbi:LysR family transcriptional regulator [Streptococcus suis]|uniref:LysR family transcriptional regulator n=2 Tax=Streptococcus suis TaxID=1307 RepID=A0A4T2H4N5_STRSU|nr:MULTISPECIES: LysR family transcriptional regulator [Streptococcus]MBM7136525.1 LysR family transcriptional regulator [Streptococcus suis]MBY0731407.1 LysR family transcriptional regulator [Streptococcus sp. 2018162]MCL4882030.1 LysR family transcriptional regulator [Streptococcus suis]MCO8177484.1 LysR family transcriptional regulator [Streptococcus suis]TII07026.1 LysR family transcriptional regulator [Streptococcus suis]
MLQLQQLEQLIAFADQGTLSKAAEVLLISQPSLTRNMQSLEDELGVQLFQRSKNKLVLTETGEYTVKQARKLLKQGQTFLENVQRFSMQATTLFGGICAPGVEWELRSRLAEQKINQEIHLDLQENEALISGLLDEHYQFIVTDFLLNEDGILSTGFFMEQLYLSVPPAHPFALREEIQLSDLADLTMLLRSDLGIWQPLVDSLTETKFIVQKDWDAFEELVSASALPSFSTNITQQSSENDSQRVHVPISDKEATKTFYISVLKKNKAILSQLTEN